MEYEEEILENEKSKLLENITNSQKRNMAFLWKTKNEYDSNLLNKNEKRKPSTLHTEDEIREEEQIYKDKIHKTQLEKTEINKMISLYENKKKEIEEKTSASQF